VYLKRKGGVAQAEATVYTKGIDPYVRYIVSVYSAIRIDRDFWLTRRELDFFVATVTHVYSGILNPISDEALQIYKNLFSKAIEKRQISTYLNILRKKQWLKYDPHKKIVYLPPLIQNISLKGDRVDFSIRILMDLDEKQVN